VADDPGYRDVMVGGVVWPELVPRAASDLLQYRTGQLGRLALADQEPHEAALGDGAGGEACTGRCEPRLGLTVVKVIVDDERDEDVGVKQDGGHSIVLERADVFGGDYPAQAHDGQPGRGTMRQPCRPALAEPAAHEESDGLAECPVSIPGDRHHLRMKISGKVNCGTHKFIISSMHLDALASSAERRHAGHGMREVGMRQTTMQRWSYRCELLRVLTEEFSSAAATSTVFS
jgi:hypothetical protein